MNMTLNDAFNKATNGDRRLIIYRDYEKRRVAAQGEWFKDHMINYREKHRADLVELIGESMTTVTVALKEEK